MNKPSTKKLIRYLGFASIFIGGLLLLGFLQGMDPECYLTEVENRGTIVGVKGSTYSFLRMCDGYYKDISDITWWLLLASATSLIAGFAFIKFSEQKPSE